MMSIYIKDQLWSRVGQSPTGYRMKRSRLIEDPQYSLKTTSMSDREISKFEKVLIEPVSSHLATGSRSHDHIDIEVVL